MADTRTKLLGEQGPASDQTMRDITRWACLAGGGLAAYAAVRRGGPSGILMGALGGVLLYQGATGHSAVPERLTRIGRQPQDVHLVSTITIDRPASDLYDFWKGFTRLPEIMSFLERVEPRPNIAGAGDVTHWVVKAPRGHSLEWDSEVTEDVPDQRIAWRSLENSELHNWGAVRFTPAPGGRGTEVHLSMHYEPPGGMLGKAAGQFLGGLSQAVLKQNLRRFKAYMESGEIPTGRSNAQERRLQ